MWSGVFDDKNDRTGSNKLANELKVEIEGEGLRFAVVVARFNSEITERLMFGVLFGLSKCGARPEDIEVVRVPGAFEIPLAAMTIAKAGRTDGVICVGSIIEGETPHWEHLSRAVTFGMLEAGLETGVPVSSAVLTTKNEDQASKRSVYPWPSEMFLTEEGDIRHPGEASEPLDEVVSSDYSAEGIWTDEQFSSFTSCNRGFDAALVAVEMALKYRVLNSENK